jgi:hypothetical protein
LTDKDKLFAFVLMPFDKAFEDIYRLGIKDTARRMGIVAQRVDEQIFGEGILEGFTARSMSPISSSLI